MGEAFGLYKIGDDEGIIALHHRRLRLPRRRSDDRLKMSGFARCDHIEL